METIKIGSFNTKDSKQHMKNGLVDALITAEFINEEKFDLLGTQELTINYLNQIKLNAKNYSFYGSYRYGNGILAHIPYNENNNIVTNKEVVLNKTVRLPWIPRNFSDLFESITKFTIMPRIATIVVVDIDGTKICMINTHLDYQIPLLQMLQLTKLKELILKYSKSYPVILTGDLNMKLEDLHFLDFVYDLKNHGMKIVPIDENTFYGNDEEKTVDYMFVPESFDIIDAGTIDTTSISDHKAIYAKVKIK